LRLPTGVRIASTITASRIRGLLTSVLLTQQYEPVNGGEPAEAAR